MDLVALSGAGTQYCSLTSLSRHDLEVQLEAETHPVLVGFSTVWQSLTTGVPRTLAQIVYYCIRGPNNLSTGFLVPCSFSSSRVTTCLPVHQLRNSLRLISCSCLSIYILHAKHDQTPSLNKINYPYVLFIGSSFVYLLEHPSTPASGTLPTEQQYNGCFVNTSFILSTHHCLSLLIAFNTLFLSRLLCFSTLWTQYICNESI